MKAQALKPSFFNLPSKKDKEAEKIGASDEERALSTLSETKGWVVLEEFIQGLLKDLDSVNATAIASGATFEEIGKNTVVVNMAKEVINRIITKVTDAKEATERVNE
jgi:hypothetical protein